jgi:hypothetical protein
MDVENPVAMWMRDRLLQFMMKGDWYLKFATKEIVGNSPVPVKPINPGAGGDPSS